MQELRQIGSELRLAAQKVPNYNKKMIIIVGTQFALCIISLVYCIVGMYHQYYKGLVCLIGSLAITSTTYVTVIHRTNPAGILFVDCIVLFVFNYIMSRKWAYLKNDHDIINDFSY
ncbi:Transmembrane_domain-containing protein [Hexamita inflata]|uniref:Transmembrane domain-containing protein n=1 Tax=Hexamita inflata TaxID=28002 RepID=A0AA86QFL9_9EUKA|nr:Transmembrane domain-containing protein [Hexamita inflata]